MSMLLEELSCLSDDVTQDEIGLAQILLSHERYQDYHRRFSNSINSMFNTLPSKYERDAK